MLGLPSNQPRKQLETDLESSEHQPVLRPGVTQSFSFLGLQQQRTAMGSVPGRTFPAFPPGPSALAALSEQGRAGTWAY